MQNNKEQKLIELREKLEVYEAKLAKEMVGYRGVIHESAASEIKHTKVMVYRAMIDELRIEIKNIEEDK